MDEFAKLDFDGDEKVTLQEMMNFELRRLCQEEILLVGICWVGHCIDPRL